MQIRRAGLIPYIVVNKKVEMMFMMPSDPAYGGSVYQIAKGMIDDGEKELEAALREASEELGLNNSNILHNSIIRIGEYNDTVFFACNVKNKTDFSEPHYETGSVKWMTIPEFLRDGRHIHRQTVNDFLCLLIDSI